MKKEEILAKAQRDGKEKDLPEQEARKNGAWLAYIIGVILLILVDTVNGFVLHNVNRGADFALFSMPFVIFTVKYLRLRRRHELGRNAAPGRAGPAGERRRATGYGPGSGYGRQAHAS